MTNSDGPQRRATITVEQAAELLGISRTTAYESVGRGEIPALRFGKRIVVLRDELERRLACPPTPPGTSEQPKSATRSNRTRPTPVHFTSIRLPGFES